MLQHLSGICLKICRIGSAFVQKNFTVGPKTFHTPLVKKFRMTSVSREDLKRNGVESILAPQLAA